MPRNFRVLEWTLILCLALSSPVLGLRPQYDKAGLEAALDPDQPITGLETDPPLEVNFHPTSFAANYLSQERLDQIVRVAGAVENGEYDAISGQKGFSRRGVIIALRPEERFAVILRREADGVRQIAVKGTTEPTDLRPDDIVVPVGAIKLAGVGVEQVDKMVRPEARPFSAAHMSTLLIGFDDQGLLYDEGMRPHFWGPDHFDDVVGETEATENLLSRGTPAGVPLGHGEYPELVSGRDSAGFKALGIPDADDLRFGDLVDPGVEQLTGLGRLLREVHDGDRDARDPLVRGQYHGSPTIFNFTADLHVRDLIFYNQKSRFRTPHEILGRQYIDLVRARNWLVRQFGPEAEEAYLRGYFHDRWEAFVEADFDWGLAHWIGWGFFGEMARVPAGWLDNPTIRLMISLNPGIEIPEQPAQDPPSIKLEVPAGFRGEFVVPGGYQHPQLKQDVNETEEAVRGASSTAPHLHLTQAAEGGGQGAGWISGMLLAYAQAYHTDHLALFMGVISRDEARDFEQRSAETVRSSAASHRQRYGRILDPVHENVEFVWVIEEDLDEPISHQEIVQAWLSGDQTGPVNIYSPGLEAATTEDPASLRREELIPRLRIGSARNDQAQRGEISAAPDSISDLRAGEWVKFSDGDDETYIVRLPVQPSAQGYSGRVLVDQGLNWPADLGGVDVTWFSGDGVASTIVEFGQLEVNGSDNIVLDHSVFSDESAVWAVVPLTVSPVGIIAVDQGTLNSMGVTGLEALLRMSRELGRPLIPQSITVESRAGLEYMQFQL